MILHLMIFTVRQYLQIEESFTEVIQITHDPLTPPTATFLRSYIANIEFTGITQSCPTLTGVAANNVVYNAADIAWTAGSGASVQIEYGPAGFAPGTGAGTAVVTSTNPYNLSSLMDQTDYDVYVRDICAVWRY